MSGRGVGVRIERAFLCSVGSGVGVRTERDVFV